ncbi:MAG: hypothetical protein GW892_28975 [Armatimonadetes bacterium]|nr:hypothetical protein [Armatimonadota bacterium]
MAGTTARRLRRVIVAMAALCPVLPGAVRAGAEPTVFYVATNGNDAWTGRQSDPNAAGTDGPFATLERARDAIRGGKAGGAVKGAVTVFVRAGLYALPQTLKLAAQDSGTVEAPVAYRAYEDEKPVVIGGKPITGFAAYKGKILKAEVRAQGLEGANFRQLFCNGRRQQLARYPNFDPENPYHGGWAYADGKPVPIYQDQPGEDKQTLPYAEADARQWAKPEEGEVFVFPRYNWWNNIVGLKSVDRDNRLLILTADCSYPIRPTDRYYVQGLFEELDAPGEWYLERESGTLYFWPPADADPANMAVYAPMLSTIVQLDGASRVTFRGFTMECCSGTAVVLSNATGCLIAGNTIRSVGEYGGSGVSVNGGKDNGVVGNDIYDVGRDGISLSGGDAQTLTPAGNYADNNYIHHTGVFYKQGVGVALSGVGNRASRNLIHDCPRFGIVWGGNDHVLELNEIRHVNLETADCGAIYSWQVDWTKRGTEIRYNYLHDIIGFGQEGGKWTSPHFNWGIYLDDGTCGTHVHGNLVVRTILGGAHVHGGRDNVIENNVFVDGRDCQMQYSGYVAGGHPVPMMTDTWKKFSGTPAYQKYPGYAELTKSLDDAWQMAGNKFLRNIVCYANPNAALYRHGNLPFDKTESNFNLVWHYGKPLLTGLTGIKGTTGPNLVANPGFEEGEPGALPTDWQWQVKPNDTSAALDTEVHFAGKQSIRIDGRGTTTDTSGQTLCPNFVSAEIPVKLGQTYRLSAQIKAAAPDTAFGMLPQSYTPNVYFWAKGMSGKAGTEWKEYETVFRFPAPGEGDYRKEMKTIRVRIDIRQDAGTLWLDEVTLQEATAMDEWEAWQNKGLDQHSAIADPRFVDPAKDDYRLKPDSPALALGFKPLPVDQIGPYKDELRATWPIQEARGAREQMVIDWSSR